MRLFVGLGNPGAKYARNRHNIGFMALEAIAGAHNFGPWRRKFQGRVTEGRIGGDKILALEPETLMNRSGQSVGEAMRFYKLDLADVVVFHDELDLAPGKVRVKTGGGHAGHNGLRSLHGHIGEGYTRVRLGIGHPGDKAKVTGYVLSDFAKADAEWLDHLLRGVAEGAPDLAAGDTGRFMNAVAQHTAPVRASGFEAPGDRAAGKQEESAAASQPAGSASEEAEAPETRSPLQKLKDRFT